MKRIVPTGRKLYSTFEECLNMKKISRRSFLAAAGLSVAALALTACGGSSSAASSVASSAASSEAASTSAAAGELTTVMAGKLTMATNATFPPYEMTTDSGDIEGIDVDTAKAIAEKLGLELQVDDMEFDAALLSVQQGKADIAMAGITVTDERKAVMAFSDSYATGIQSIIVPEGSDIASPDDLAGKKIGTQRGTTGYIYCTDDFGEDSVVAYDNGLTAVQALNNGQVDAVVIDNAPAKEYVAANPGLKVLETSYAEEDYAIGMNKDNTALVEAVNAALEELKADGTLQSIVDKYITAD
jgi:ABC-type amino acid transport substrate-binding protein